MDVLFVALIVLLGAATSALVRLCAALSPRAPEAVSGRQPGPDTP